MADEEKWGRKRFKVLKEYQRRKREGTDLNSRERARGRDDETQRQRRAELAELQQERRDLDAGLGGPKSYFDQYRRRVYDPLKDSNVNNVVRETRRETSEKRKADRQKVLQGMADRMVASGRAGSVNLNPSAMDVQAAEIRQRTATAAAKARAERERKQFLTSLGEKAKGALSDLAGWDAQAAKYGTDTGLSAWDRMWNEQKHKQALGEKRRQGELGRAGGSPVAMGGVQFTGPNNTPFKAGSGNGRKVHEYAAAKAREAQEHAMHVALRSAQNKADREERAAKGDFLHRNYNLVMQQRRLDEAIKRGQANAYKVLADAAEQGLNASNNFGLPQPQQKAVQQKAVTSGIPVGKKEAASTDPEVSARMNHMPPGIDSTGRPTDGTNVGPHDGPRVEPPPTPEKPKGWLEKQASGENWVDLDEIMK